MKVYKNPNVPLQRANKDGSMTDALCWKIEGAIHVHPDRWDFFVMCINQPDVADHPDVRALLLKPLAER